jgi:hypothetical protein
MFDAPIQHRQILVGDLLGVFGARFQGRQIVRNARGLRFAEDSWGLGQGHAEGNRFAPSAELAV